MKNKPRTPSVALTLGGILMASTVAGVVPATAKGQAVESRRAQQQQAKRVRLDIAAGPLDAALAAFEAASELSLRIEAPIVGFATKGVSGEYTPQEALGRLLDGTGLTFVFTGEKVVMVRKRGAAVLDAVTVTADASSRVSSPKYTAPQRDIPRTITVIPGEVLQAQGATSLRDVIRNVPGITINAGEGGGAMPGDNFNIRGFSAANDIFVDGVRDVSGYARESFNLEAIEVVKGPNSAVSGRGSTGGSVNMVTKTPGLTATRSAVGVIGSAEQRRATIDVNQPFSMPGIPGTAVRVNAVATNAGVAGNEVIENGGWGVAPSLAMGLGTPTQLTLAYTQSEQDNIPAYGLETFNEVPKFDTRRFFGLRGLDFEHVRSNTTMARLDHAFSDRVQVRNQLTRGHSKVDRIVTPANPTTGVRSPKTHIVDNEILTNQTNLTTRLVTGSVEHTVVAGVEASREESMRGSYTIQNRPLPVIADLNDPSPDTDYRSAITPTVTRRVKATSLGAYAFETMQLTPTVSLNGGLRWESYKPEYTDSASLAAAKASGFAPRRATNVSGSAGLVIKPVSQGTVYASFGTSFNPATENLSNDALNANSALPPERSRTFEVGSKWDLFKQRVSAAVALFRTDKTNARTSDPANPGLGTILAGKQRVEGGEASISGQVTDRWNVLAGYSHLESEYRESLNPAQVGTSFTNVPKHSVNTWTTYRVGGGLEVGGGGRYVDRRLLRANAAGDVYVPSYHTYDAMASYRWKSSIGVQLNLYNLTDQLYYDSGRMWVPAPGRAMSLATSVKF